MPDSTFHITNGDSLTKRLLDIDVKGELMTWNEMLCEGPTISNINSKAFVETRKAFLNDFYDIEVDDNALENELKKLNSIDAYKKIVLWFEYDLFCHINMLAVIALLGQRKIQLPIYLVCSGWIEGETNLKGLPELTDQQLIQHYKDKIKLSETDLELAHTLWDIYCGKDHNLFKPYIVKSSSFKYLSNCLKAHLKRFPDSNTGLDVLETNVLQLIKDNNIKSKHHLLGYALNYQGYYGFGDIQFERLIDFLSDFYDETPDAITLNRNGHEALLGIHNFSKKINNSIQYGGINRLDYQYCERYKKLIKRI